jgi:predicted dehydrogenase
MTVRVGFLGAGFIAEHHVAGLAASGADVDVAAVWDPDSSRAVGFADRHGAVVADGEGALVDAVDAVYVCTPTVEHPRLVRLAADAGRAVFCEKPLGVGLAEARDVAAAVADAGVVNQVGLVLRDSPSFLLLRSLIDDPDDGPLLTLLFRDDQYLPVRGVYGSRWRGEVGAAGGGTLLEHSIHDLDLLTWLGGPVVGVSARTAHHHRLEGIEDVAGVHLEFASGGTAQLVSVWHDVLGRPSLRHVEVFRQRGWYALEGDVWGPVRWQRSTVAEVEAADAVAPVAPGSAVRGAPGEPQTVEDDALRLELRQRGVRLRWPDGAFVASVAAGVPASPSVADALDAHVLAETAYRSAAAGGEWLDPQAVAAGSRRAGS